MWRSMLTLINDGLLLTKRSLLLARWSSQNPRRQLRELFCSKNKMKNFIFIICCDNIFLLFQNASFVERSHSLSLLGRALNGNIPGIRTIYFSLHFFLSIKIFEFFFSCTLVQNFRNLCLSPHKVFRFFTSVLCKGKIAIVHRSWEQQRQQTTWINNELLFVEILLAFFSLQPIKQGAKYFETKVSVN